MTFAEKARKEHPEFVDHELGYPVAHCPHHKPFEYPDTRKDNHCSGYTCRQCWEREMSEEMPNALPDQQRMASYLWDRYVSFQEAGFDKAQAFDLTRVEYEAMLEESRK